jgi:chorismate synthase
MGSVFGKNVTTAIFGESHGPAIGVTIDGLPAGFRIDMEKLGAFLDRRAPGRAGTSARREADRPEFISGLKDGVTCGSPLTALIRNTDARPRDYEALADTPRPAHADYTAHVKYGGFEDRRGGGHFSGRLTAPLCIAGGIFIQLLERSGITVSARITEIGGNSESPMDEVAAAAADGDSVGGVIECVIEGMPAGIGEPMFGGIENHISQAVFGIPGVKGIEFGSGFAGARMRGSENNDAFICDGGEVRTETNNHGGILGGITSGMPVVFRAAFKPTPSIAKEQMTISYSEGKNVPLSTGGRHDPCIAVRAVPCVEAAAAMAVYDLMRAPAAVIE